MYVHPTRYKDGQCKLWHNHWLAKHVLFSLFPFNSFAGKVFAPGGYTISYTSAYPPQHKYPYLKVLDWMPHPSYDGPAYKGFLNPLVFDSTLRWTLLNRLNNEFTLLVALRPYAQDNTEFNPSIDPIPHFRLSTPHVSIKCRNGNANPFFVDINGFIINLPTIKEFCWLAIAIKQNSYDILFLSESGNYQLSSGILGSSISPPVSTYIELNYEKLPGYGDAFDPRHNDHLVGEIHLLDKKLPVDILFSLVDNINTVKGWIHPNNRGLLLFFYPTIEASLESYVDLSFQIYGGPIRSALFSDVVLNSQLRSTLNNSSFCHSEFLIGANDLAKVESRSALASFSFHTATPFEATSMARPLIGDAVFSMFLINPVAVSKLGFLTAYTILQSDIQVKPETRSIIDSTIALSSNVIYSSTLFTSISGLIANESVIPANNDITSLINAALTTLSTDRILSELNLISNSIIRFISRSQIEQQIRSQLDGVVFTDFSANDTLRSLQNVRNNSEVLVFSDALSRVQAKGILESYFAVQFEPNGGILAIVDTIQTSNVGFVFTTANATTIIDDMIPAFGHNKPKHIIDL